MMVDIIDTKQTSVELINLADIFSKFFFCCLRMVRESAFDFKYRLIAEFVSKSQCQAGTLIPSVRRLVWAGKPQLGNAACGASFPSERALPAGGFGSVHTPSP